MEPIARNEYGLNKLFITCNPDYIALYKTLKKLGCELLEVVQTTCEHKLYGLWDKMKYIFKYKAEI